MTILHFSLGPVQSFIAQSRRTRDLWAGSFLLSYLIGHAMAAIQQSGGRITFPDTQGDRLLQWIQEGERGDPPLIGSLPNRFQAEVTDGALAAQAAANALRAAWRNLAQRVWDAHPDLHHDETKGIWERQINAFWEVQWAVGDDKALDRRKNWRHRKPPDEPREHCTIMGDLQELSGHFRGPDQETFWKTLRGTLGDLEIRKDERLCAIAFIRRRFAGVMGWPTHFPSTAFIAAVPWIERAAPAGQDYAKQVREAAGNKALSEYHNRIPCLKGLGDFAKLDGNFFHPDALQSEKRTPLQEDHKHKRSDLQSAFRALKKGQPSSFFALLLMDGDNMGQRLGRDPIGTSQALATFCNTVEGTVRQHKGVLIYAGGDDVLAMLPVATAVACARDLNRHFREAFRGDGSTLSAGITLADFRTPLRFLLGESHRLLDQVAKGLPEKDALAIALYKGDHLNLQWAAKWNDIPEWPSQNVMSSGFLYHLREYASHLSEEPWQPGQALPLIDGLDLEKLLISDLIKNREQTITRDASEQAVRQLMPFIMSPDGLRPDGALLMRFLAKESDLCSPAN